MYFSTNGHPEHVDFKKALLVGQAPDKGLYMPEKIPAIPRDEIIDFSGKSYPEVAYRVLLPYLQGLVPEDRLRAILKDAYSYDLPVETVFPGKYVMRLDRGPTCSFKDFAARLMAG
jgi:threonine synthase